MCSKHGQPPDFSLATRVESAGETTSRAPRRRYELWEIPGGLQCSIIGTCLPHEELKRIARRLKLVIEDAAADYEVHAYFVNEAARRGDISRAIQKELDRRFDGLVRRVGQLRTEAELIAFWKACYDGGRIAGGYWAILSHRHASDAVRQRVFGEVHMLSHVLGRTTHASAVKACELEQRIEDLESKLRRQRERHGEALADRDRQIARLKAIRDNLSEERQQKPTFGNAKAKVDSPRIVFPQRNQRALSSARERARIAEADAELLRGQIKALARQLRRAGLAQSANPCPGAEACRLDHPPRRVLYLGGRASAVERLRSIAASANAEFVHHDGGVEQTVDLIDGFINRCDAVFCPVDCISHGACERAKALCRKHEKVFVPLRSSGASTFKRALIELHR
ncbi:MAG: DUF2325 domain-containing protein [Hyphomicrobiaceae bacterium]